MLPCLQLKLHRAGWMAVAGVAAGIGAAPAHGATVGYAISAVGGSSAGVRGPEGALNSAFHLLARHKSDRRPRLRARISGAGPGEPLRILVSRGPCSALQGDPRDGLQVWSGKAAADGSVVMGTPDLQRLSLPGRLRTGHIRSVAVATAAGSEISGCAPARAIRPVRPGERPKLGLIALASTSGSGLIRDMAQMNMQFFSGTIVISGFFGSDGGLSDSTEARLSIGSCDDEGPRLTVGDIPIRSAPGRIRLSVAPRTLRAIARPGTHFSLSAPIDGAKPFACSASAKVGKLLGLNYSPTAPSGGSR